MTQDQTIALYESVAEITGKMLAAAHNGDWDDVCTLEADCANQIRTLKSVENAASAVNTETGELSSNVTEAVRLRQRTLIEKILVDDREIRQLTESRMAQLSSLLSRARVERQLLVAYGGQQAP